MIEYLSTINPIWHSLGPLIIINAYFVITLALFAATNRKRVRHEDVDRKQLSKFMPMILVEYWYWILGPIERVIIRLGISPDALTVMGLVFASIGAYFFHLGMIAAGGWFMVIGASFDILDGRIARLTHRESRSGAYFDSVIDRYGEAVVFIGLASWYRESSMLFVVMVALIGSLMVSYTRARGEGIGVHITKGMMQRPERILYLGMGSILSPAIAYLISLVYYVPTDFITTIALIIIAIFTIIGSIYRIQAVLIQLDPQPQDKRLFRRFIQRWVMRE